MDGGKLFVSPSKQLPVFYSTALAGSMSVAFVKGWGGREDRVGMVLPAKLLPPPSPIAENWCSRIIATRAWRDPAVVVV